jgi:hypothetical protein
VFRSFRPELNKKSLEKVAGMKPLSQRQARLLKSREDQLMRERERKLKEVRQAREASLEGHAHTTSGVLSSQFDDPKSDGRDECPRGFTTFRAAAAPSRVSPPVSCSVPPQEMAECTFQPHIPSSVKSDTILRKTKKTTRLVSPIKSKDQRPETPAQSVFGGNELRLRLT